MDIPEPDLSARGSGIHQHLIPATAQVQVCTLHLGTNAHPCQHGRAQQHCRCPPTVTRQQEHNCSQLTQSVSHGDDGSVVQLRVSNLVGQQHSQVRPPVSPRAISTALEGNKRGVKVNRDGHHKVDVTGRSQHRGTQAGGSLLLTDQRCLRNSS